MNDPQGIPVGTITNSVLDDGTMLIQNGIVKYYIQNDQLVTPEVPEPSLSNEDADLFKEAVEPQLEKSDLLETRIATIEKQLSTVVKIHQIFLCC